MFGSELPVCTATAAPASEGVLAVDLVGRVIYVNRATESWTGRTRHDLLGQPLWCVFGALDGTMPQGLPAAALRAPEGNHLGKTSDAWILHRRDWLWNLVELSTEPIHDRDGAIAGAIIVFRGVSGVPACLGALQRADEEAVPSPATGGPLVQSKEMARW